MQKLKNSLLGFYGTYHHAKYLLKNLFRFLNLFHIYLLLKDLKKSIIDDGLSTIVNHILLPHSGWSPTACSDICWSTVFRNTSGVLRYL